MHFFELYHLQLITAGSHPRGVPRRGHLVGAVQNLNRPVVRALR
jgi:hypothetical protein